MERSSSEVESIPPVVTRVQEFFDHYGLNASSAAKALGYNTTSKLYKILQGSEPSLPTLGDFLTKWPELSVEWLVLGNGPMLRSESGGAAPSSPKVGMASKRLPAVNSGRVLTVTVDREDNENTELVPVQAQAGYGLQHNEAVYLSDLPRNRIPGFEHGTYRAFEVAGDSMEPTLKHRDIVVASYVDNWRLLVPGDVYVVVTDESVMLKRIHERITDLAGEVMLHSDNPHRKPYAMDRGDISQIWRVRGYISTYIPSVPDVTVERLWEVIDLLGGDRVEVRRHLEENAPTDAPR
jgi:signal peptidase I